MLSHLAVSLALLIVQDRADNVQSSRVTPAPVDLQIRSDVIKSMVPTSQETFELVLILRFKIVSAHTL